jgi:hypothetical protein
MDQSTVSALEKPSTDKKLYKNSLRTNPLYAIGGWVPMTYERSLGRQFSVLIGASFIGNNNANLSSNDEERLGFYVNPAIRFYLSEADDLLEGFYFSPEIGYMYQERTKTVYGYSGYDPYYLPYYAYTSTQSIVINEYQGGSTFGYQAVGVVLP